VLKTDGETGGEKEKTGIEIMIIHKRMTTAGYACFSAEQVYVSSASKR
jgi:hypothetical protein